jgi:hypothetical protein
MALICEGVIFLGFVSFAVFLLFLVAISASGGVKLVDDENK